MVFSNSSCNVSVQSVSDGMADSIPYRKHGIISCWVQIWNNFQLFVLESTVSLRWHAITITICHVEILPLSIYRCNHNPVFSSFMTYHRIGDKNNTRNRNCLQLQSTWVHFWFLVGFLLVSLLFSVYCFINHYILYALYILTIVYMSVLNFSAATN
jgi:hypothetical protein